MIITLVKADFSTNYIDKLNHWNISYNVVGYLNSNTVPYIEKDAAYESTLTLIYGNTYKSSTILMGGEDITTTALTWNEDYSEGTIFINKVTGPLIIEVEIEVEVENLFSTASDRYDTALRYSPGGLNIVNSSSTKYALFFYELEPNTTYTLKTSANTTPTGNLFATKPVSGAKTDYESFLAHGNEWTFTTDDTYVWFAVNISTLETSDGTSGQENGLAAAWTGASLYKV